MCYKDELVKVLWNIFTYINTLYPTFTNSFINEDWNEMPLHYSVLCIF